MAHFTVIIPPYVLDGEGVGLVPNKAMLPVGPLAIAATLLERGHRVEAVDLVFTPHWQQRLEAVGDTDHLLLSCHTVRNIGPCIAVLSELRANGFRGHVTLGGNACLELGREEFAERGLVVDTVTRGYAHGLIDEIVASASGDLWSTSSHAPLLPPAVELLDEEAHRQYLTHSGGRYPIIGHGYGCAWACSYCTAKMGAGWTPRPLEEIEAEFTLAKRLGYPHLWCVDNLVLVDAARTITFDQLVSRAGLTWSGMDRAEQVIKRGKTLAKLKALKTLAMGVETVSRRQLRVFGRHDRPNDYPRAFALVKAAGITAVAFVILDCPETDEEDFWRLYQHLKNNLRPNEISWSFYAPPQSGNGFYHWPLGCSTTPPTRVVQQAMILSGVWWKRWGLNVTNPFFENDAELGVNFEEGQIVQTRDARSPIGDSWKMWRERPA